MCIFSHEYKNISIIFDSDKNLIKIIRTTSKNVSFTIPKEPITDKKSFSNYVKKYYIDSEKCLN